jgi:GNAT superfamily N-acetyltransferase
MSDVTIRPAGDADLAALTSAFGDEMFFVDRLARQRDGRGQLLTACLRDLPVGHVYIWWEDAEEREVQELLPGIPLLNRVKVLPSYQNQGIGTELVLAAEKLLMALGHKMVALAVRYDNEGARRLYKRLDYRVWDHPRVECRYELLHPDGTREHGYETCDMLVKDLTGSS